MRVAPFICLVGLFMGCGDSGSLPGQRLSGPTNVSGATPPNGVKEGNSAQPESVGKTKTPKSIEVKTGAGSTRIETGNRLEIRRDFKGDQPLFYPVLRNFHGGDFFHKNVPYLEVADGLGVFACRMTKRPDGGLGLDYVLTTQLADYGLDSTRLLELCYENFFKEEIEVKALKQGDDLMLSFSSPGGLVTALLGHSSSYEKFSGMLKTKDIAILIDGPQILLATARNSSFEAKFPDLVRRSDHKAGAINLDPAHYHWTKKDGLKLVTGSRSQTKAASEIPNQPRK